MDKPHQLVWAAAFARRRSIEDADLAYRAFIDDLRAAAVKRSVGGNTSEAEDRLLDFAWPHT